MAFLTVEKHGSGLLDVECEEHCVVQRPPKAFPGTDMTLDGGDQFSRQPAFTTPPKEEGRVRLLACPAPSVENKHRGQNK